MRSKTISTQVAVFIMGLLTVPVWASELPETAQADAAKPETAEEIRSCARKNFPQETSVQKLEMVSHDLSGGKRTLNAKMFWRVDNDGFSNVMIRVSAPRDLSGSSYLVLEKEARDDMFMYLPAVQRVRRIVGNMKTKPLWGTDLSYEDVKQLQGVAVGGTLSRLEDAEVSGRKAYVIQTVYDAAEESAYGRVVTHVDSEICMPLQVDFYDLDNEAVKKLVINPETFVEIDGRWQMRDLDMQDLHSKTHTEIRIEVLKSDEKISSRVFNSNAFYQGGG